MAEKRNMGFTGVISLITPYVLELFHPTWQLVGGPPRMNWWIFNCDAT